MCFMCVLRGTQQLYVLCGGFYLCAQLPSPAEESHLGVFWSRCTEITYLLIGNECSSPAGHENAEVFYQTHTHTHTSLIKCQNTGYANQFKTVYTENGSQLIQRGNREVHVAEYLTNPLANG